MKVICTYIDLKIYPYFTQTFLPTVKPRRERVPTQIRQWGSSVRRDGAKAPLSGEGDPSWRDSDAGDPGRMSRGPTAQGDDWSWGEQDIFHHFLNIAYIFWQYTFLTYFLSYLACIVKHPNVSLWCLPGYLRKAGEWTPRGQPECRSSQEKLSWAYRTQAYT